MSETALHQAVTGGQDKEYLSFVLGDEHYALDITTVKEIRGYEQVTKIANAPAFIKGVINLRGDIVPIVDLRIKFNVGEATYNAFTIVIMLNIQERIVGIVVDGVSDVIRWSEEEVLPRPKHECSNHLCQPADHHWQGGLWQFLECSGRGSALI